jgi:hypothetical protein
LKNEKITDKRNTSDTIRQYPKITPILAILGIAEKEKPQK